MQSATTAQTQQTGEPEFTDLELHNTSSSPKHQEEVLRNETNDICPDNSSSTGVKGNSSVALDEDTKSLWTRCNALLRSDKKITKLFIISACIHLCVLVSVTVSVSYATKL